MTTVKKKPSVEKKTQRTEAPSESFSELLSSIVSLVKTQQETNALILEWQNRILESLQPRVELKVAEEEPKVPEFVDEITYQVYWDIATKFEYEMSIEVFGEYKTRAEAERMLETVKEQFLWKPYTKYATPIYFKTFNIKENITKVMNG